MNCIRCAKAHDLERVAEIEVFNYRLNFYPIFRNDEFYFEELSVSSLMKEHEHAIHQTWVYDDGVVKGFIQIDGNEIKKLFVEPVLQGKGIGAALIDYAIECFKVRFLWALEKNQRAIAFYDRNGFHTTEHKRLEEGTTEYLIRLER